MAFLPPVGALVARVVGARGVVNLDSIEVCDLFHRGGCKGVRGVDALAAAFPLGCRRGFVVAGAAVYGFCAVMGVVPFCR